MINYEKLAISSYDPDSFLPPEPVQSLAYILISSVPVLLLLLAITGISCFWLFVKR